MTTLRTKRKLKESLSDHASRVDQDHEVDLARSELYQIADHAVKLHDLLKNVSEEMGLDAEVQAKITQAAMTMDEVYHALDYELKPDDMDLGDELGIDDMEPDPMSDIENDLEELPRPARSLESRKYKRKPIRESRNNNTVKRTTVREMNDFETKLSDIFDTGMDKIMTGGKKTRLRENTLADFAKSGKGGLAKHGSPEQVRELQIALKTNGFNPGPTDGIYGGGTAGAVRQFQKKNGLKVDGDAGPATLAKLLKSGKPFPPVQQPTGRDSNTGGIDPRRNRRMTAGEEPLPTGREQSNTQSSSTRQTSRGSRPARDGARTGGGF